MTRWYTRPVIFVSDMPASVAFYLDVLAFEQAWANEQDGQAIVTQVARGDCEVILCLDPNRKASARLFVSLEPEELAAFRKEIAKRSIPAEDTWWGYPCISIQDPDGNELLFPIQDEEPDVDPGAG
jgi:catechol 2,3-dioxygenase-like lactoylglutathione lyase family enzyme